MRFITSEYQKILDGLSREEKKEVIKVLESVEKDVNACAKSAWCRTTADRFINSLKYHWKDWLQIYAFAIFVLGLFILLREKILFFGRGDYWNTWLARWYFSDMVGTGFFSSLFNILIKAVFYSFYFYILSWAFVYGLKLLHVLFRSAEDKWSKRRKVLFEYLDKRDKKAEASDPSIWYLPREKEEMKKFADHNPNYRSAKGRAWTNDI